jgi:HEAT repeat protein
MRGLLLVAALATLATWTISTAQTTDKDKDKKFYLTDIGGKTLEQWIKEIPSVDRSKGENAIQNVLLFPPEQGSAALPVILTEMAKHNPRGGTRPIDLSIRVNGAIAVGILLGSTKDPDPKHVKEAVRLLREGLGDTQKILVYRSAEALGRIGPEARSAIPALLAGVRDSATWEVREASALALGRVAYDPKEGPSGNVLAGLYYALEDNASQVRLGAIQSLGMLGAPNNAEFKKTWVRNLEKTAKDPDTRIVIWGQMAIMAVLNEFPDARVQSIGKLLTHPEAGTRIQAAQALGTLGNKGKSQVPLLIKGLKDRTPEAAGWCVYALSRMGLAAASAIPELQALTKDTSQPEPLRKAAAEAVDMIQGKGNKGLDK